MARGVLWPSPVAARLPYSATRTALTGDRSPPSRASSCAAQCRDARMGPTVCEELGPMPTLYMSNSEMDAGPLGAVWNATPGPASLLRETLKRI